MRMDVGIWTKKKLVVVGPKREKKHPMNDLESHWLRFEKVMDKGKVGMKFVLTDVDFLMRGNTFFKSDDFKFRSM